MAKVYVCGLSMGGWSSEWVVKWVGDQVGVWPKCVCVWPKCVQGSSVQGSSAWMVEGVVKWVGGQVGGCQVGVWPKCVCGQSVWPKYVWVFNGWVVKWVGGQVGGWSSGWGVKWVGAGGGPHPLPLTPCPQTPLKWSDISSRISESRSRSRISESRSRSRSRFGNSGADTSANTDRRKKKFIFT